MTESARYEINHVSRYSYASEAHQCAMLLCLQPRSDAGQQLLGFRIETFPSAFTNEETDCFGNHQHLLNLHGAHERLEIRANSDVVIPAPSPLPDVLPAEAWKEIAAWQDSFDLWDFTRASRLARNSSALEAFTDQHKIQPLQDPLTSLVHLSDSLHDIFEYLPGSTTAESPIEEILESGRGVCQDYAHVMISIARRWGIPSRYVSGYLYIGEENDRTSMDPVESGFENHSATHAWVECLLPELGWVGFDPTNRGPVGLRCVRIANGRDYADVSPTHGVLQGGGEIDLKVEVTVKRLHSG